MNREEKIAESLIAAGQVFDMATVDDWVNKLQSGIKAPTVGVKYSTLGGEKDVSILIMVSMDDKKDWINNILENSHYVRLHLYNDGVLDMISGHVKPAKNFRKTRVMSVEDAIMKINRYVVEVDRARAENKTGRTGMRNEVVAEELVKVAKSLMADNTYQREFRKIIRPMVGLIDKYYIPEGGDQVRIIGKNGNTILMYVHIYYKWNEDYDYTAIQLTASSPSGDLVDKEIVVEDGDGKQWTKKIAMIIHDVLTRKVAKSLMAVPMTFDAPSTETTRWAKKTLMITLNVDASWKQIYASLLTVQEGTSNKFHYFGIFKSRDGECVGGNAYGRIGYNPKAIEIARGGSSALVMNAVLQKVSQKRAKGYQVTEV
jgi:hypothetical protein